MYRTHCIRSVLTTSVFWFGPNFGFFLTFQANNIVHYKVDCEPSSVKKSAELGDEREVKLKGISGSDSVFYKTVSGQHVCFYIVTCFVVSYMYSFINILRFY